jgi:hypothetical protein
LLRLSINIHESTINNESKIQDRSINNPLSLGTQSQQAIPSQDVDRTIRPLPHITDALLQIDQQLFL